MADGNEYLDEFKKRAKVAGMIATPPTTRPGTAPDLRVMNLAEAGADGPFASVEYGDKKRNVYVGQELPQGVVTAISATKGLELQPEQGPTVWHQMHDKPLVIADSAPELTTEEERIAKTEGLWTDFTEEHTAGIAARRHAMDTEKLLNSFHKLQEQEKTKGEAFEKQHSISRATHNQAIYDAHRNFGTQIGDPVETYDNIIVYDLKPAVGMDRLPDDAPDQVKYDTDNRSFTW